MFDLHSHILPGMDDGASSREVALAMARVWVDQGVQVVACTPHILPGVHHNSGSAIRAAVASLQSDLVEAGIALHLVVGADNHVEPNFVSGLADGRLLAINDTRYVLVEPPHHVAPARLAGLFVGLQAAGYVPILTHPERVSWISDRYDELCALRARGVLMQVTAISLSGAFGWKARYWTERMLSEGRVDVLASDAHDLTQRPPDLATGHARAIPRVGRAEADALVTHRPRAILENVDPTLLPPPLSFQSSEEIEHGFRPASVAEPAAGSLVGRLWRPMGHHA